MKKRTARILIWIVVLMVLVTAGSIYYASMKIKQIQSSFGEIAALDQLSGVKINPAYHIHADFMMYINDREVVFTDPSLIEQNPYAHLHAGDDNINVIHMEGAEGVTLSMFFRTLGMNLTRNCISFQEVQYCSEPEKGRTLKYYVNGEPIQDGQDYVPKDLDKILISYGSSTYKQIQNQLDTIGDRSLALSVQAK